MTVRTAWHALLQNTATFVCWRAAAEIPESEEGCRPRWATLQKGQLPAASDQFRFALQKKKKPKNIKEEDVSDLAFSLST